MGLYRNLLESLEYYSHVNGDAPAYIFVGKNTSEELSYKELLNLVSNSAAQILSEAQPGDRVVLAFDDLRGFIINFLACVSAGVIAVPTFVPKPLRNNRNFRRYENIINDTEAIFSLTSVQLESQIRRSHELLQTPVPVRVILPELEPSGPSRPLKAISPEDIAYLQYTSGSTGQPKGVIVTHRNLSANHEAIYHAFGHSSSTIIGGWLPMFHDMGLVGNVLHPLCIGVPGVLMTPMDFLNSPFLWLKTISDYRLTTSGGPDFAYRLCVEKIPQVRLKELDLSCWNLAFNGSEAVQKSTLSSFADKFKTCGFQEESFFPCYGLAEATLMVTGGKLANRKPSFNDVSIDKRWWSEWVSNKELVRRVPSGSSVINTKVVIADPESKSYCTDGTKGEVLISGPGVTSGYWNKPELNEELFVQFGQTNYLRTGDIGYLLDNQLYLCGRLKDMVIIRGRNFYPEDIEECISQSEVQEALGRSAAFSRVSENGEQLVVVVELVDRNGETQTLSDAIVESVSRDIELDVNEVCFIRNGTLPTTNTGKKMRAECRNLYIQKKLKLVSGWKPDAEGTEVHQSGQTDMELAQTDAEIEKLVQEAVVTAIIKYSGKKSVDLNSHFYSFGIDSLKMLNVKHHVSQSLGVDFDLKLFYQEQTISEVIGLLAQSIGLKKHDSIGTSSEPSIDPKTTIFPLSRGQASILFLYQQTDRKCIYHISRALKLVGELDRSALVRAWMQTVQNYPVLNNRIFQSGNDIGQYCADENYPEIVFVEPLDGGVSQIKNDIKLCINQEFDLEREPPVKLLVYKVSEDTHVFFATFHHIFCDQWSLEVVLDSLKNAYAGTPATTKQVDHGIFQFSIQEKASLESNAAAPLKQFWQECLIDAPLGLSLPYSKTKPLTKTWEGGTEHVDFGVENSASLSKLSAELGVSRFAIICAGLGLFLGRYLNVEDVVLGVPFNQRGSNRYKNSVGYFVNTLPIRVRLSGSQSFESLVKAVSISLSHALAHSEYPLTNIVNELKLSGSDSIFNTMLVMRDSFSKDQGISMLALNKESDDWSFGRLSAQTFPLLEQGSQADMSFLVVANASSHDLAIEYNSSLYDRHQVIDYGLGFVAFLDELVNNKTTPIERIPLERNSLPVQPQGLMSTTVSSSPDNIAACFNAQVKKTPEAVAVSDEITSLSYSDLSDRVTLIATNLQARGIEPGHYVAVYMARSVDLIAVMLAIIYCGAAYLPCDPKYPSGRTRRMFEQGKPRLVVAGDEFYNVAGDVVESQQVVRFDELVESEAHEFTPPKLSPVLPAYLIFTSGSTGIPKGVAVSHLAIVNRLHWMENEYAVGPGSRILQKTSIGFDVSVWELFLPLICGGELVFAKLGIEHSPSDIRSALLDNKITMVHFVPSMLRAYLSANDFRELVFLEHVIVSGEALDPALMNDFYDKSDAHLHNLYGPTEAAVDVTFWNTKNTCIGSSPPIGKPIWNTSIYVLDKNRDLLPTGAIGEIAIAGDCLAQGYVNSPRKTAAQFIPDHIGSDPSRRIYMTGDAGAYNVDGNLYYIGRIDDQVKVRGNRIELGEIEIALKSLENIKDAVVTFETNDSRLIAYLVPEKIDEFKNCASELLNRLATLLPDFMLPQEFYQVPNISKTSSGKANRKALSRDEAVRIEVRTVFSPPEDDNQRLLCDAWQEVLDEPKVGIDDNFFHVGGDSIRCIEVIAAANKRGFPKGLNVQRFLEHQTIRRICDSLTAVDIPSSDPSELPTDKHVAGIPDLPKGVVDAFGMSSMQQSLLYNSESNPSYETYVTSVGVNCAYDSEKLVEVIESMTAQHSILRSSFTVVHRHGPLQLVFEDADICLSEEDITHNNNQQELLEEYYKLQRTIRFEWSERPLFRFHVHRRSNTLFQLTVTEPLLDGWSVSQLMSQIIERYYHLTNDDPIELPQFDNSGSNYQLLALQLENQALASEESKAALLEITQNSIPGILPKMSADAEHGLAPYTKRVFSTFDSVELAKLEGVAHSTKVPLKSLLLALHFKLLSFLTGQNDVVCGLVTTMRPEAEGLQGAIGTFLNICPVRLQIEDGSWRRLLQATLNAEIKSLPLRHYPIARILNSEKLAFDTVFNFTQFHGYGKVENHTNLELTDYYASDQTYFPLCLQANIDPVSRELSVIMEYDVREFNGAEVEGFSNYFERLIEVLIQSPDVAHSRFSERFKHVWHDQLQQWNEQDSINIKDTRRIPETVLSHIQAMPGRAAIFYNDQALTYQQLGDQSKQLAALMNSNGVTPQQCIGLYLESPQHMVIAAFAVMRLGCAFVPIDVSCPAERVSHMLSDAQVSCVVSDKRLSTMDAVSGANLVLYEDALNQTQEEWKGLSLDVPIDKSFIAYVVFTSGSTGRPKGVAVSHGALENLISWHIGKYQLNNESRTTQLASFSFDASIWEVWPTLFAGASLYLVEEEARTMPDKIQQYILDNEINVAFLPTPLAERMLALPRGEGEQFKYLLTGGDKMHRCIDRQPDFKVINHYGPTENTVVATSSLVDFEQQESPPIGYSIAGVATYILDRELIPVPPGAIGELYLGGDSLALGYLGQRAQTAEKFVPDPYSEKSGSIMYATGDLVCHMPDGQIQFIGRQDNQISLNGYRIELDEIESAIVDHQSIASAAAKIGRDTQGNNIIQAYVVAESNSNISAKQLRKFLSQRIPAYMLPTQTFEVPDIPLTPNGKVSREALDGVVATALTISDEYHPPSNQMEEDLHQIWSEVLERKTISVRDSFYDVGGHSLLATQIVSRIRDNYKVEFSIADLLEFATIELQAKLICERIQGDMPIEELTRLLDSLETSIDSGVEVTPVELTKGSAQN